MKQLSNTKNNRGFTFIELILYISIVTIMLSAIIPFAWNIIGTRSKSSTEQEVFSQARYVSERIKYEIRNASDINSVSAGSINLNTLSDSSTVIDLSGGKVRVRYGTQDPIPLNSNNTNVTTLEFVNYTSADQKTKHIGFVLTIEMAGSLQRQEFKEAVTLGSSAEVRSN